jgi:oligopeptide/dipeptide ABC transporter ATP-binding protein
MVFQDPTAALNPVYTLGWQVAEALRLQRGLGRRAARLAAIEALRRVGFPDPEARFDDYPHELSGGMRQRVMLAIALSCGPELLIADEPTAALDTLAAAQIAALLADLKRERRMSLLLISHDVSLVADSVDEVAVLYAGRVVEQGATGAILAAPLHPYTRALVASAPPLRPQRRRRRAGGARLPTIAWAPQRADLRGCRFAPRCPEVFGRCHEEEPPLYDADDRLVRCFLFEEAVVPLTRRPLATPEPPAPGDSLPAGDDEPPDGIDDEISDPPEGFAVDDKDNGEPA